MDILHLQTHPWIFRDSGNPNERLVVKKQYIKSGYFECDDFLSDLHQSGHNKSDQHKALLNGEIPICVLIQLPVENLRHLALKTVRRHLPRKEDCFCLQLGTFIPKKEKQKGKKQKHDFKQEKLKKFQKIESAHLENVIDKYFMNDIVPYSCIKHMFSPKINFSLITFNKVKSTIQQI